MSHKLSFKNRNSMLLLATILFVVLSPGVLLTLPPVGNTLFMSGKTSFIAVLLHAVFFYILLSMRRQIPVVNIILEGFSTKKGPNEECGSDIQCKSFLYCKGVELDRNRKIIRKGKCRPR
jgi:hypothetical protein